MKKIMLLDTSIGTSNMGDFIIMDSVRRELAFINEHSFVYEMPTHLPCFNAISVWKNSIAARNYAGCDLKFAGGSNLLVKDLRTHYPQWNINLWNSKPLQGVITVGVGAGAGDYTNKYTAGLYKKILNHEYYHSVRDERSREYVESLGLKAINTGCVTMWGLTPEFCRNIPDEKASRVVFTLTGKSAHTPVNPLDEELVSILKRNYKEVFFWIQGDLDESYFNRLNNTDGIQVIPPSLKAYDELLSKDDLDYVGTRLHGGIYAMQHKKRAIIIAIDERAREINAGNHLNCIEQNEIPKLLNAMINSDFSTAVKMPFDDIERWKGQFAG